MTTLTTRQGETLELLVELDDDTAASAEIVIKLSADDPVVFSKATAFVDGVADLTMTSAETDAIATGLYVYQIKVIHDDSSVDIYPDTSGCDDDDQCGFPEFSVCEALG